MRIAINGMGRIGRLLFRRLIENENFEVAAVNDLMPVKNLAYLLKYDSVYGTFSDEINANEQTLIVNEKEVKAFREGDPASLPWKDLDVDVVLECTGKFVTKEGASKHLQAGAKKVLLSTTGSDDIPLGIFGHNQNGNSGNIDILSPGGCMTNCSVHVLYVLNTIGIQSVHLNILHSYTSRQAIVDMPNDQFRRGRAAAESIIPVAIDLHKSLNRLMPALKNKINVFSTRIPVANGAMASFSVQLKEEVTTDQLNKMFQKTAENNYKGIMDFTEEPLVSLDIKGNSHSCIIDGTQTSAIGNHVRVVAWFDNEFGFTSRMIDWLNYWNKK
ncbi:MAG TPA: type I glyceraldehyde-3-phosphate dehydrogenase [Hanamia sp.]|nr:type I glyceraldehyde-3-phosphate dehydrogenase [Hanamia sp.]